MIEIYILYSNSVPAHTEVGLVADVAKAAALLLEIAMEWVEIPAPATKMDMYHYVHICVYIHVFIIPPKDIKTFQLFIG